MIALLVLDVDGTLTDGRVSYSESGDEIKSFNAKDGLGIALWLKLGREVAIITGRESKIVARRASELKITHIFQGVSDKGAVLRELLAAKNLSAEQVAIVGDDLNDLSMMRLAGHNFAPKDAAPQVKKIAKVVRKKGGSGAVREVVEYLIKKEKLENEVAKIF